MDLATAAHRLEPALQRLLAEQPALHSAAVALVGPDGESATAVLGTADPVTLTPLTDTHTYRIASCTKPLVAATVVDLAATGVLALDTPVNEVLAPAVAHLFAHYEHASQVTVRHLLQHRSGLVDHTTFPEFEAAVGSEWTPLQQLAIAMDKPALFAPGRAFSYSDSGYVLLGQIVERLTAIPLAAAVRARAGVDAATMPSLHWERAEPSPPGFERVHQWFQGHDTFDWNPTLDLFGGGGLVSTLTDLARWWSNWFAGVHGHLGTHLGHPAPTLGPDGTTFPGGDRTGLGLFGRAARERTVWSHGGFWGLETGHVPDLGVSYAAALTHCGAGLSSPRLLADATLDALLASRD